MTAASVMLMQSQGWWLALLLCCSLTGVAQAKSLAQQVFQLLLVINQIRLERSVGDRVSACVKPAGPTNFCSIFFQPFNRHIRASNTLDFNTQYCRDAMTVESSL